MYLAYLVVLWLLSLIPDALASPLAHKPGRVALDSATAIGTTSGNVTKFLGIPYARPPIGDLRFRLPKPVAPYTGTLNATVYGPSCPQQTKFHVPFVEGLAKEALDTLVSTVSNALSSASEDCLTLNVIVPNNVKVKSKLPVLVWIFGGGFEGGSTKAHDGGEIVERSMELGEPIIYVSMNYRVSAFGFLASKEVKKAGLGNLGLQDQREALRWIQKYIGIFGGDPKKVTIWGESAGAISVGLQMVANNGNTEGLFRGGFMQSGSAIPVGDILHGQKYYDALVNETKCSGTPDTLACLRKVPYSTLKKAVDKSPAIFDYQALILAWLPRTDGVFLTDDPQKLVKKGKIANIPFVTGSCDDEGTVFSLSNLNVSTTKELRSFIQTFWLPEAKPAEIEHILKLYPEDPAQGSPYGTGSRYTLSPQFKRLASFQGDAVFQAPRRYLLEQRADKQNAWSFLSKRMKYLPVIGAFHGSDLRNSYGGGELADYLIHFTTKLDPNGGNSPKWPKYTNASPKLLTFKDTLLKSGPAVEITMDTYRKEAMEYLNKVTLSYPL